MFLVVGLADNLVVIVDKQNGGLMALSLIRSHLSISHDYHLVAYVDTLCSSTVKADDAGTCLACDDVSLEAATIVDIGDSHHLIFHDARLGKQVRIDSDTAHIVEVGLCHCSTVYLCLQHS